MDSHRLNATGEIMPINETLLRETMRYWTTGVTVVTSTFQSEKHGMTVSSFTSVSVTPPIVCISLNTLTKTHRLVEQSGIFAVTVLEEAQGALSDCFAGRVEDEGDRFYGIDTFTLETGAPLLTGGIAFFDCKVIKQVELGQNTVFFGEVISAKYSETGKPLLYSNRSYQSLQK